MTLIFVFLIVTSLQPEPDYREQWKAEIREVLREGREQFEAQYPVHAQIEEALRVD